MQYSRYLLWVLSVFLYLILLLVPSPGAFCQESGPVFQDDKTYQVTGAHLNKLAMDFQTIKRELAISMSENEKLKQDSIDKQKALDELQMQLKMQNELWQKSQNRTLVNDFIIGGLATAGGIVIGLLIAHH